MKRTNRILAMLLVAAMLLLALAACAVPDEPPVTDPPATNPPSTGTDGPGSSTEPVTPPTPTKRYDGETYTILAQEDLTQGVPSRDVVYLESEGNASINQAVRDRNNYIYDQHGVTVKGYFVDQMYSVASKAAFGGLSVCEAMQEGFTNYATLIDNGYLLDMKTLSPYLDMSSSVWSQTCVKNMSIAGRLFFCAGDIMITDKGGCWAIAFNRDLISNNNLESPYDLVDSKGWTYDKMYELAEAVCDKSSAPNPDDYFNITWGIATDNSSNYMVWQGCGVTLLEKTDPATDIPSLAPLTEGAYDAMIKTAKIQFNKEVSIMQENMKGITGGNFEGVIKLFQTGHALFKIGSMSIVEWMRNSDIDFGVLPMPKYAAEQDGYYSSQSMTFAYALGIPVHCRDTEMVGFITQALAEASTDTLLEAYYDNTLVHKGLRRPEDVRMLDLVFGGRIFDLSMVFNWASSLINKIASAKTEAKVKSLKSAYDGYKSTVDKNISDFIEKHNFS